jgi:Protein of unknown function (DUF2961)
VKIYLDGDGHLLTLSGTRTEDYIGTGYGQGAYAHPKSHWCRLSTLPVPA